MATIAENLLRIQSAKTDIKEAIEAKGVTIPSSATIDTYADYVASIPSGGGGDITTIQKLIDRSITSIDIPSGITTIGSHAFNYCNHLSSVTIPSSVMHINSYAFANCTSLSSITIPNSVINISNNVFEFCSSITSIDIPSGVTYIGSGAFQWCTSLTSINIPSGVTSIGFYAFSNCSSLTSITINAVTPPTLSNTNAFNNTNNCPIYVPSESVETYKSATNWSTYASRIQAIP